MSPLTIESMDYLVAYRQESVARLMAASRRDSENRAALRVRIGVALIRIGERLRSEPRAGMTRAAGVQTSPPWSRSCPTCA